MHSQFVHMQVSFQGMVVQHNPADTINADEISMTIGDATRDIIVKFVAHDGFNQQEIIDSVGRIILLKHVYVLNQSSVFYDEHHSIASSYQINPPNSDEILSLFDSAWKNHFNQSLKLHLSLSMSMYLFHSVSVIVYFNLSALLNKMV